jgi:hypothetical protein
LSCVSIAGEITAPRAACRGLLNEVVEPFHKEIDVIGSGPDRFAVDDVRADDYWRPYEMVYLKLFESQLPVIERGLGLFEGGDAADEPSAQHHFVDIN